MCDALQPGRVAVEACQHDPVCAQLEQVPALAAGRRTGIQHPPLDAVEQPAGGQLRRSILYRYPSGIEPRQAINRHRARQPDRSRYALLQFALDALPLEGLQIVLRGTLPAVHAQPHWRPAVVRRDNPLPVLGPVPGKCIQHPPRMVEPGFIIRRLAPENPVAQRPAEYGVDEGCMLRPPQQPCRLDGLGHDGVIRNPRFGKLVQADRKQRVNHAVPSLQRPVEEAVDLRLQPPVASQGPVAEEPQQWPIGVRQLLLVLGKRSVQ